jgi:hypothetical protein
VKDTKFKEEEEKTLDFSPLLEVHRQCLLVLLVEVSLRDGEALRSE